MRLATKELPDEKVTVEAKIRSDIRENSAKSSHFQRGMTRNCNVMLNTLAGGSQAKVASALAGHFITVLTEKRRQFLAGELTGKPQTRMTSSLTRCSRTVRGLDWS